MAQKNFKELFDPKQKKWSGFSIQMYAVLLALIAIVVYVPFGGKEAAFLRGHFLTMFTLLAVFGIFFGEIGDRIPIWNDYVGGGTVLVFFAGAVFGSYKLVPEPVHTAIRVFYGRQPVNFLEMFIPALIVGSVLTINRKTLLKSIAGYIPLIIIGVIGATIGGIGFGLLFGKSPLDIMMNYVLPIMGGGTGAGAIPMSEMWAQKTGGNPGDWFAFAISILTIANIIAIFVGAFLNELGKKHPSLTGNGELMIDDTKEAVKEETAVKVEVGARDIFGALVFTGVLFAASHMSGIIWSSMNFPFDVHRLAFLVIYCIILNVMGIVPATLKAATKQVQSFFSKYTIWILMAAVGFTTSVQEIINSLSLANLFIAAGIVIGATVFIMVASKKMKFYPVEAAITAGLCMANRGGSGDIAVLGAAHRMDLISFAQISSRVGGAMMLIFGSIIFGIFA